MPKRSTLIPLALTPRRRGAPVAGWLYDSLRREILAGRLKPGARLPASRELARLYGISRGSVVIAFDQLASEGYVEGTTGSGTYVSRSLPDENLEPALPGTTEPARRPRRPATDLARHVHLFPGLRGGRVRAFRANRPALDLFPTALWAQIASRRLRRAPVGLFLGCEAMGHLPLREAVADYLTRARHARCTAEQVLIVSGVQEALDLTTRLVAGPGDRVAMEDPGYIGARLVFEANGARVVRLRVDDEGAVLHRGRLEGVRLLYLTPSHQFPLGVAMSLARRLSALEWARKAGAFIFEDDYDSEYRYSGQPLPALQGLGGSRHVLLAGSFSKVLFPSLRLGYLVIPADLVDRFAAVKSITTRHAPVLDQAVLAEFMSEGHFARHIRRMRRVYAERLESLRESARKELAGALDVSDIEAGLQTVGWLRPGLDAARVAEEAAKREVEVTPLTEYGREPRLRRGLHLGFAAPDEAEIRRGVRELAAAIESS